MQSPVNGSANSFLSSLKATDLAAGVTGGLVSTIVCHPLDIVKVRLAVNDGFKSRPYYENISHICRSIYSASGFVGFYQGVTPNILGAASSWGLYFFFYNALKNWYLTETQRSLSPSVHMLAAAQAGAVTLAFTNPIWVCKTRLCLQYENRATFPTGRKAVIYSGFVDCLSKTFKHEGVRGLYSGFSAGLFGVSHGAIQFMAYEEMKKWYSVQYNVDTRTTKVATQWYLLFSAVSKLFAVVLTYPYQVLRARLQDQHRKHNGLSDVFRVSCTCICLITTSQTSSFVAGYL